MNNNNVSFVCRLLRKPNERKSIGQTEKIMKKHLSLRARSPFSSSSSSLKASTVPVDSKALRQEARPPPQLHRRGPLRSPKSLNPALRRSWWSPQPLYPCRSDAKFVEQPPLAKFLIPSTAAGSMLVNRSWCRAGDASLAVSREPHSCTPSSALQNRSGAAPAMPRSPSPASKAG
jgi:hypothetical protein